jgi:hypothetical protein
MHSAVSPWSQQDLMKDKQCTDVASILKIKETFISMKSVACHEDGIAGHLVADNAAMYWIVSSIGRDLFFRKKQITSDVQLNQRARMQG